MASQDQLERDLAASYGLLHGVCFACLVEQDLLVIQPELDRRMEQHAEQQAGQRRHPLMTAIKETGRWATILLMALWLGLGSLIAIIAQAVIGD